MTARKLLLWVALALGLASPAAAQNLPMLIPPPAGGAAFTGVGDVLSGAKIYWGTRAYTAAYATAGSNMLNVRRNSDNVACDFKAASTGGLGVTTATCDSSTLGGITAATFCAATTCYVTEAYDQTGNGNSPVQSTAGAQPPLNLSYQNSLPCVQWLSSRSSFLEVAALATNITQPFSVTAIAERTAAFTQLEAIAWGLGSGATWVSGFQNAANTVVIYASSANITQTASDSVMHSIQILTNSAAAQMIVDNSAGTAGAAGAGFLGTAAPVYFGQWNNSNYTDGGTCEFAAYNATTFTSTQYGNLRTNEKAYWNTP